MRSDPLPFKPEDQPEASTAAADLAQYFATKAFRKEVGRQIASHQTQLEARAELREYWAQGTYSHAAKLV